MLVVVDEADVVVLNKDIKDAALVVDTVMVIITIKDVAITTIRAVDITIKVLKLRQELLCKAVILRKLNIGV
jgi:hypothetical protein